VSTQNKTWNTGSGNGRRPFGQKRRDRKLDRTIDAGVALAGRTFRTGATACVPAAYNSHLFAP